MWLEFWERLRGYDKWVEASATIETPHSEDASHEPLWTGDVLVWTDHHGQRQAAEFIVPDDCTLYQKVTGDKLLIRYNPHQPEQFYFRQLHRIRVHTTVKRIAIAISLIGLVVMAFWVRERP